MRWSPEELIKKASADYGTTWMSTVDLVSDREYSPQPAGSLHFLSELTARARAALTEQGYSEVLLPLRIDESRIRRDAGPAAPLMLADSFQLLTVDKKPPASTRDLLPRIQAIASTFNPDRLAKLLLLIKSYSLNEIDAAKLLSQAVERTGLRMEQAAPVVNAALGPLTAKPLGSCLRPSMVPVWPSTLAAISKRQPLPLQLFSIGPCFSGNTSEHMVSGAALSEDISFDDGIGMARLFMGVFGAEPRLERRTCTSPFFIPGTETDLLIGRTPVGRCGLVSPIVLSHHGLSVPVFVFELSFGRMAAALKLAPSSEALHYPQFYGDWALTDQQIASMISAGPGPKGWGIEIASKIVKTCDTYAMQPAPCEFKLVEHDLDDKRVEVWLTAERGTLCGRDYSQEVYVLDGEVIAAPGMPVDERGKLAVTKGLKTRISILRAFADHVAASIETDPSAKKYSITSLSDPSQVNIIVPDLVRNYIKQKNKSLAFAGDVNITVETRVKPLWQYSQPR